MTTPSEGATVGDRAPRDSREAFHLATAAVYADLGRLVAVLKRGPDLRVALLTLDEYATPGSAPDGDPEFIADLKHTAGRLRSSLATARKIREQLGGSAHAFGNGGYFGGVGSTSHHEALLDAANEVLEPDEEGAARAGRTARPQSASGAIRQRALADAMDSGSWAKLAENLKHEYELASLHADSVTEHEARRVADELEQRRRERKHRQVQEECETVPQMFSLWQETTDLLFRTNLGEDARVEELAHLRHIAFALAAEAHKLQAKRDALHKLCSLLRALMPREWFDESVKWTLVLSAVNEANIEATDLYLDHVRRATADPSENVADAMSPQSPALPATTPDVGSPGFFREGDGWMVEFAGKRAVIRDLDGMGYIQRLLSCPGTPVPATKVVGEVQPAGSRQEVASPEALKDTHKRLQEIAEDLEKRAGTLSEAALEALHRERARLVAYVASAVTPHGARSIEPISAKASGRSRGAIARALDAIKAKHDELWKHLDECLLDRAGANPCYRPMTPITWRVNA